MEEYFLKYIRLDVMSKAFLFPPSAFQYACEIDPVSFLLTQLGKQMLRSLKKSPADQSKEIHVVHHPDLHRGQSEATHKWTWKQHLALAVVLSRPPSPVPPQSRSSADIWRHASQAMIAVAFGSNSPDRNVKNIKGKYFIERKGD